MNKKRSVVSQLKSGGYTHTNTHIYKKNRASTCPTLQWVNMWEIC